MPTTNDARPLPLATQGLAKSPTPVDVTLAKYRKVPFPTPRWIRSGGFVGVQLGAPAVDDVEVELLVVVEAADGHALAHPPR